MKKLILTFVAVIFAISLFAQTVARLHVVATATTKFNRQVNAKDFVYNTATSTLYYMTVSAAPDAHLSTYTGAGTATAVATTALSATVTSLAAQKLAARDSVSVALTKMYRGTSATAMWVDDTVHSILGFKTGVAGGGNFGVLTVQGASTLAGVTATKVRALDSLLVGSGKLYRGTTNGTLWSPDTIHSVKGFRTGTAGLIYGGEINSPLVAATDSIVLGTGKLSRGGTIGVIAASDSLNSAKGFSTGITGRYKGGDLVIMARTDTTTKTAGRIVYVGGYFWGGN